MILRFNINPAVTSCRQGCFLNTSQVAETVKSLVNSFSFNLSDIGSQTLYVQQPPAFYSWSGQQNLAYFLEHELVSYRYSSCCLVVLVGATSFQIGWEWNLARMFFKKIRIDWRSLLYKLYKVKWTPKRRNMFYPHNMFTLIFHRPNIHFVKVWKGNIYATYASSSR